MSSIYITGHRNPDFDSVASAIVYAHLKNHIDPDNEYIPVRCGVLNPQTRSLFAQLEMTPPPYKKDVHTIVKDVVEYDVPRLKIKDPLQTAIAHLDETNISLLPVFDDDDQFKGIVSSVEISHFLMRETFGARPLYRFRVSNLSSVIPGKILRRGRDEEFTATIMIGAMPFEHSTKRIKALKTTPPLLIVGMRKKLVAHAIKQNFPAIILTGTTEEDLKEFDFSNYSGSIYLSDIDTAETVRLLRFSTPLEEIVKTDMLLLDINEDFEVAKSLLASSGLRGLPVFDDKVFTGIVSRISFLNRPRNKIILVDHNELSQSIPGARDADIVEIIDHHRVGSVMSREAFSILTKPVGCTCTILRQLYRQHGVAIPTEIAKLMLSAILSDTILLKSPTTTEEDKTTVEGLARHAGLDWQKWGQEMFESGARLVDMDPHDAVNSDFKSYSSGSIQFGIGQVEVQSLSDLDRVIPKFQESLEQVRSSQNLNATMLLITDVMRGDSVLLSIGLENAIQLLPYEKSANGALNLPGILSRKKQLLPDILRVIEDMATSE